MNNTKPLPIRLFLVLAISITAVAAADYTIDWQTVDGGGRMSSTGGDLELSGTIGQPDAGVMTGGDLELVGGFWALRPSLVLVSTEPDPNGSLPKTQNNLILCEFDRAIELPTAGNPLVIQDMSNGCLDVSDLFVYSIDTDDPNGCTLQAKENLAQLTDAHWYQVNSSPGWTDVVAFQFEVYTLRGDCDSSGRVTTGDYACVKEDMGARGDVRADLDGSRRVTTGDYGVVKDHIGARKPAKPALCP